jgi:hypothetical protein
MAPAAEATIAARQTTGTAKALLRMVMEHIRFILNYHNYHRGERYDH